MELRELICLLTPEEERSSLEELIGDFEEEEPESFFDRSPELVNGYDSAQTFAEEIRDRVVTLGTVLIWYLAERGLLMVVDWDGEEEENLLASYVNYRLESLGADFTVDTEEFYPWAEEEGLEAEDGSLVWSLLQEVDRQLRNQGFRLLGFDTFCEPDSIYLGVLPEGLADTFLRAGVTDVDIAAPEDL